MAKQKKSQISIEYLVVIGFVIFVILGALGVALFFSSQIRDSIKFNQLERFANKLITSAESVFYAGMPSKTTITAYLPEGVREITISNKEIIFNVDSASGQNKISYSSGVVLNGTITSSSGLKRIQLIAQVDRVVVVEV